MRPPLLGNQAPLVFTPQHLISQSSFSPSTCDWIVLNAWLYCCYLALLWCSNVVWHLNRFIILIKSEVQGILTLVFQLVIEYNSRKNSKSNLKSTLSKQLSSLYSIPVIGGVKHKWQRVFFFSGLSIDHRPFWRVCRLFKEDRWNFILFTPKMSNNN